MQKRLQTRFSQWKGALSVAQMSEAAQAGAKEELNNLKEQIKTSKNESDQVHAKIIQSKQSMERMSEQVAAD